MDPSFQTVGTRGHCKVKDYCNRLQTGFSITHCYPDDTILPIFLNDFKSPLQNFSLFLGNVIVSKPEEWSLISLTLHPDSLSSAVLPCPQTFHFNSNWWLYVLSPEHGTSALTPGPCPWCAHGLEGHCLPNIRAMISLIGISFPSRNMSVFLQSAILPNCQRWQNYFTFLTH